MVSDMVVVDAIATKPTGGVAGSLPDVPLAHGSFVNAAQTHEGIHHPRSLAMYMQAAY